MQTGKLDQRIILQSVSETNDNGQLLLTYSTVATVWGKVISQRGNEAFEAARTNATETLRILIRHRDDVTNKWRVSWNDQFYEVINTDRSMRRKGELWLTARLLGAL